MENIIINWSGPYGIENLNKYDIAYNSGIYAISRVWGNNETLLYLGKTVRDFATRLDEHQVAWVNAIQGQIKVRVGVLEFEQGRIYSKKKLGDVEALLINWHKPQYNTMSKNYYYGRRKLTVINRGRKGALSTKVSTEYFEWS